MFKSAHPKTRYILPISIIIFACAVTLLSKQIFAVCQGDPTRNCNVFPDATSCSQNGCSWVSPPTQKPKATQIPSKCQGPADRSCHVFPDQTTCLQNGCSWDSTVSDPGGSGDSNSNGGSGSGSVSTSNCVVTTIGDSNLPAANYNPNDCNNFYTGKFALKNPLGNFGDPNCTLTQSDAERTNKIAALFLAQDPVYANDWITKIVPYESGFNANAVNNEACHGTAYGLLQMGGSCLLDESGKPIMMPFVDRCTKKDMKVCVPNPGQDANVPGLGFLSDRGDLPYELQISKAIQKNRNNNNKFEYWGGL